MNTLSTKRDNFHISLRGKIQRFVLVEWPHDAYRTRVNVPVNQLFERSTIQFEIGCHRSDRRLENPFRTHPHLFLPWPGKLLTCFAIDS